MTPHERAIRFAILKELGCLVARLRGVGWVGADIHHQLTAGLHGNGERIGDHATIALSPWSHTGRPVCGMSAEECREVLGPSYAHEAAEFRRQFGTDAELLHAQDELIRAYIRANYVGRPYWP